MRFGADVELLYPTGGATGQLLRHLIERERIPSLSIQVVQETREDFTVMEAATGLQYRFVLPGHRLEEREWKQCLDILASLTARPKFVVASGSLPPAVPEDFYVRVTRIAKDLGARTIIDTSGAPLRAALEEGVYLVKVNLRELRDLSGRSLREDDDRLDAGRDLVERGNAEVVALTLGDEGALLITKRQAWRVNGLPIKPESAVGAGDSFLGAMVWRLAMDSNLEDALRYGVAAGSAAVLQPGTELCRPEDVERLLPKVKVERVPSGLLAGVPA